jgi:hypothetical protein
MDTTCKRRQGQNATLYQFGGECHNVAINVNKKIIAKYLCIFY